MCSFELTLSKLAQKIKLVKNPISFLLLTYVENICKDSHATFPFITYLAILRDNLYMILVPYCKLLPTCKAKTSLCTLCKKSGFLEKCIGNFMRKTLKFKHNAKSFLNFFSTKFLMFLKNFLPYPIWGIMKSYYNKNRVICINVHKVYKIITY